MVNDAAMPDGCRRLPEPWPLPVNNDETGRALVKPPRNVLRVFLSLAADYDWFNPDPDCGAWMRKHNPSDFYNKEFLKT